MSRLKAWILLFVVFYIAGQVCRTYTMFSYLHEFGHVLFAYWDGVDADIVSRTLTHINGNITLGIAMGGFWTEIIFWSAIALLFSFSRWNGFGGIVCGFCYGFQNRIYMVAQTSTDFERVGILSYQTWRFWGVLILFLMYLILVIRLYRWFKEEKDGMRSYYRKDGKYPNTEQSIGTDLW